jgi:hypothetical protein
MHLCRMTRNMKGEYAWTFYRMHPIEVNPDPVWGGNHAVPLRPRKESVWSWPSEAWAKRRGIPYVTLGWTAIAATESRAHALVIDESLKGEAA